MYANKTETIKVRSKLAETITLCPQCMNKLSGQIVQEDSTVYLERLCKEHGVQRMRIATSAAYYRKLRDYYYGVIDEGIQQSRYLVFLTGKCNLKCPICFYGGHKFFDISKEEILKLMRRKRGTEFVLFGKEVTCRDDLPEVISMLRQHQHSVSLYSNGLRITNKEYLKNIKKSGLSKIYLQFDGFSDEIYKSFREVDILNMKIKALNNLRELKIDTVLNVAVALGKNNDQLKAIIDYAIKNDFIKTINLTAYIRSGSGKNFFPDNSIMPDELVSLVEDYTENRISKRNVFLFQKLFYAYMSFFERRACFYIQYFWIYRFKESYLTIDRFLNLERAEAVLDNYKRLRRINKFIAKAYLLAFLPFSLIRIDSLPIIFRLIPVVFSHVFKVAEYTNMSSRFVQLIFSTACDPYKADFNIAKRCHIGVIFKNQNGVVQEMEENGIYILQHEMEDYKCLKK